MMRNSLPAVVLALCGQLAPSSANAADHHGEHLMTVFLSAEGSARRSDPAAGTDTNATAEADLILSKQAGPWRLLAEVVVSPDEHEIERLQLGYEITDNSVLWLGRIHQPASAWNVLYHHGQYLQPSISRPTLEDWEDEQGYLPQHTVGGMIESLITTDGPGAWRLSAAAGLVPEIRGQMLEPYVPFHGDDARLAHGSLRLEWLPDALGEDSVGLIASRTRMSLDPAEVGSGTPVIMRTAGVFAAGGSGKWRTIFNATLLDPQLTAQPGYRVRRHLATYLQLEYSPASNTTLVARHELLTNTSDSAYFSLLRHTPVRRSLIGGRQQLGKRNALSVELSRNTELPRHTFHELRLQWSTALP